MPKVEQYGLPQQATQNISRPRMSTSVPSDAFGGPVARALGDVADIVSDMQKRVSTTKAEEALVRFEREKNNIMFNPESGYLNTQGRDAFEGSKAANQAITDLQKKYIEELDDEGARQLFTKTSNAHVTRSNADIMRHAQKGLRAYEVATLEAEVENAVESASLYWNDSERLGVEAARGRQAIIDSAKMQGLTGEPLAEKLQTYRSAFYKTTINTAIANSSSAGEESMEKYGSLLEGPDRVKLESALATKKKTEQTQIEAEVSVAKATQIVSQYDSREDIIEQVNSITDPKLRDKTMRQAMYQFNQKKRAQDEAQAEAFEMAEGYGSAEMFQAAHPEEWERLSPKQRSQIESGKTVQTDWEHYSDLVTLPKSELAKVNPVEHFHKLGASERKTLINAVKSANGAASGSEKTDAQSGRSRTAQTTEAVEIIFGKKSKRNSDTKRKVQAFYTILDEETAARVEEKGGVALTSEEFTSLLSDLSRNVTQKGTFWDTEMSIKDVPADDILVISRYLRDKGIPATADNILLAHEQAKE